MSLNCVFDDSTYGYVCHIQNQEIPKEISKRTINGMHKTKMNYFGIMVKKAIEDVLWLRFENCKMMQVPVINDETFKNIQFLTILNSNLKSISKDDLKQFPVLASLNLRGNDLETLPGDLFEFNKFIREIWFNYNKIKFIGANLLDGLDRLVYANFENNVNINMVVDNKDSKHWMDMNNLKLHILNNCQPPKKGLTIIDPVTGKDIFEGSPSVRIDPRNTFIVSNRRNLNCVPANYPGTNTFEINQQIQKNVEEMKKPSNDHQKLNSKMYRKLHEDLDKFISTDDYKDFNLKVNETNFKVHKFIFMIRSATFAEMIKNNPDAEELLLTDIPVEIFESILDFVYNDKVPETKNIRDIFAAAGKLKIESLKEVCLEILIKEMENENNLDFLMDNFNLGAKFECANLKLKAFEEIKKHFSGKKLKDDLLEQPEKLKKLVDTKKMLDLQLEELGLEEDEESAVGGDLR